MSNDRIVNWYPGHMARSKRRISDCLKFVDIIIQVIDARIPSTSKSIDIGSDVLCKPLVLAFSKTDLADESLTQKWIDYYKTLGILAVDVGLNSRKGLSQLKQSISFLMAEKLAKHQSHAIKQKSVRAMVLGHPNVGKSFLINRLAQRNRAKVENKPGVTRELQWINIGDKIELLDTPGVLPVNVQNLEEQNNLAFTGAVKSDTLDFERVALNLIEILCGKFPETLQNRYGLRNRCTLSAYDMLKSIGEKRKFFIHGGEVDTYRTSQMLVDEFRSGKLGRITLEDPPKCVSIIDWSVV